MQEYRRLQCHDQGFAFDTESGSAYLINNTGRLVYEALAAGQEPTEIAAELARRHVLDGAAAERDVRDFIERLRSYEICREAS
jgi:hypothetical protein